MSKPDFKTKPISTKLVFKPFLRKSFYEVCPFFWTSIEMMGLIGMGNNPMVGATVAVAVAIEEAAKAGKF